MQIKREQVARCCKMFISHGNWLNSHFIHCVICKTYHQMKNTFHDNLVFSNHKFLSRHANCDGILEFNRFGGWWRPYFDAREWITHNKNSLLLESRWRPHRSRWSWLSDCCGYRIILLFEPQHISFDIVEFGIALPQLKLLVDGTAYDKLL